MQRVLLVSKTEIKMRHINESVIFLNGSNNLKTKEDVIDIDMLKILPLDLKNLSDVVVEKFQKKRCIKKLNSKLNNLESRNLDASTLIQINQYNKDKQNLERKNENVDKKKVQ